MKKRDVLKTGYLAGCALLLSIILSGCKVHQNVVMPEDIAIITRKQWGAQKPLLPMRQHTPKQITIHHTAVKQMVARNISDKLKGLQTYSFSKSQLSGGRIKEPWADIPYHFYIAVDGSIGEGRELQYVGDSNTPYDPSGHALIVLEGNFENEELSDSQFQSLKTLIIALARKYRITSNNISGHKDHAETLCPGAKLYALIPQLQQAVNEAVLPK